MLLSIFHPLQMPPDNVNNLKGTFGNDKNSTWQPWSYESRKKVAKCVETFKKKHRHPRKLL